LLSGPSGVGVDPVGWWERNFADCHGNAVSKRFAAVKCGTHDSLTVILHIHSLLILEVLPDAWEIHDRFDPEPQEQLLGSNSGELQDLRAVRCSCS
jgi:hypothetical protein